MECIVLKAAFRMPALMLQKPHRRSKAKEHVVALERRLELWAKGHFEELLKEGETIQKTLSRCHRVLSKSELVRSFSRFIFEGKVRTALRVLNESGSTFGTPLSLSAPLSDSDPSLGTVHGAILLKHPEPSSASPDYFYLPTLLPMTMIPTLLSLTSLMASILGGL